MGTENDEQTTVLFDNLFARGTLHDLINGLSWQQFEKFVGHVFECAGYQVEHVSHQHYPHGPGVDLNLYNGSARAKPAVRIEVRHYAHDNYIQLNDVATFDGFLNLIQNKGVPGFLVTTSDFVPNARRFAHDSKLTTVIDGPTFLRYIRYVGGSRVNGEYAGESIASANPTELGDLLRADEIMKETARPPRSAQILAIANGKGGVAKTTSALNIAFALADRYKQRVLLIDMDGQASATETLPRRLPPDAPKGVSAPADLEFITDYFQGKTSLEALVRPTRLDNLWLIPAAYQLQQMDSGGGPRPRAELQFVSDVRHLQTVYEKGIGQAFDWIIIDTPPAQSFYARAAVAASDYVAIPAFAEQFATRGINGVLRTVETMSALTGQAEWQKKIVGCFIARWKASATANASLATLLTELDSKGVHRFEHSVPYDEKVEQAHRGVASGGWRTIFRLSNTLGPAARAYDELTEEITKHVNISKANPIGQ